MQQDIFCFTPRYFHVYELRYDCGNDGGGDDGDDDGDDEDDKDDGDDSLYLVFHDDFYLNPKLQFLSLYFFN